VKIIAVFFESKERNQCFSTTISGARGIHDKTDEVIGQFSKVFFSFFFTYSKHSSQEQKGIVHCMIQHTSASLISGKRGSNSEGFVDSLNNMVPEKWNRDFFLHTSEGMLDFLKATVMISFRRGRYACSCKV